MQSSHPLSNPLKMKFIIATFLFLLGCGESSPSASTIEQTGGSEEWLIQVKSTGRISSNHFSDFVVDEAGNSYIASFSKVNGTLDQPYIAKVDKQGEVKWELGQGNIGRATAISIDGKGQIWVVGWFQGSLNFSDKKIIENGGATGFLSVINPEGTCVDLLMLPGNSTPYNVHVNAKNEGLISGIFSNPMEIDGHLLSPTGGNGLFLATFSSDRKCKWLNQLNTTGGINRIRSDSKGNFLLTGYFHSSLSCARPGKKGSEKNEPFRIVTEDQWDNDGFLLKIGSDGDPLWIRQFGGKGATQYGYRSRDAGFDLAINDRDEIIVGVQREYADSTQKGDKNPDQRRFAVEIVQYDIDGNVILTESVHSGITDGGGFALARSPSGNIWVSGTDEKDPFIVAIEPGGTRNWIRPELHGSNTIFRVMNLWKDKIYLCGHYQSQLQVAGKKITNEGDHAIFLYRKNQ